MGFYDEKFHSKNIGKDTLRFVSTSQGTYVVGHICEECINDGGKFSSLRKGLEICPFQETEKCVNRNPYYFFVKREKNGFILFSKFRVPFDIPKANSLQIKTLKNTIIQAIRNLQLTNDCRLQAKYGTTDKTNSYDIENILFYNIGTTNFNELANKGVIFSSISTIEMNAIRQKYNIPDVYSHYYEYNLVYKEGRQQFNNLLVEFNNVCLKCVGINSTNVWKTLKIEKQKFTILDQIQTSKNDTFAIVLNIEKPQNERFNIMTAMKPLLDGLICSLHSSDFDEKELQYFSNKLNCDKEFLTSNSTSVLGYRKGKFIQIYRNNVKWNPADDLCDYVSINIKEGKTWNLSGKIFSTIKCPYCGKRKISRILYGMCAMTEELQKDIDNGRVKLAGCLIYKNRHHHFCKWCKKTF